MVECDCRGYVFFFQAEDGIRDTSVTGVQTCALPISPPPGKMPRKEPSAVPRSIEGAESLMSCQVGSRPVTFLVKTSRCSFCSRLLMISAKPNTPIATETKPIPSESSETPTRTRATPELTAV